MSLLDDNITQANEIERLSRRLREIERRIRKKPVAAIAFLDEKISQMEKFVGGYAKGWSDIPYYRNAKKELIHLKAIKEYLSSL